MVVSIAFVVLLVDIRSGQTKALSDVSILCQGMLDTPFTKKDTEFSYNKCLLNNQLDYG